MRFAPKGQPHTSPGQSRTAAAVKRRPGYAIESVFGALKGRNKVARSCCALSGLKASFVTVSWGCALPQADMWLPLRGEHEMCRY